MANWRYPSEAVRPLRSLILERNVLGDSSMSSHGQKGVFICGGKHFSGQ